MVTQLREDLTEQLKSPNYSLSWVQVPVGLGSISHHPLGSTAPAVPWRHLCCWYNCDICPSHSANQVLGARCYEQQSKLIEKKTKMNCLSGTLLY